MTCDVLFLASFHPELTPLRALLGNGLEATVGGLDVVARVTGIGLSMAAAGAAMQIAETHPRAVVLLGTCGAYAGAGPLVGHVVAPSGVRLVSPLAIDGLAQFPEPMSTLTRTHDLAREALVRAGALIGDVATTLAVTVDDALAERIAHATGARVEHLEAHGVAAACAARGIPFAAALGVANIVGSNGREEWRTNNRMASAAAVDVAVRALPEIGAGSGPPSSVRR